MKNNSIFMIAELKLLLEDCKNEAKLEIVIIILQMEQNALSRLHAGLRAGLRAQCTVKAARRSVRSQDAHIVRCTPS